MRVAALGIDAEPKDPPAVTWHRSAATIEKNTPFRRFLGGWRRGVGASASYYHCVLLQSIVIQGDESWSVDRDCREQSRQFLSHALADPWSQ